MSKKYFENWNTENHEEIFGIDWVDFVNNKIADIDQPYSDTVIVGNNQENHLVGDGDDEAILAKKGDDLIFGDRTSAGSYWHGSGGTGGTGSDGKGTGSDKNGSGSDNKGSGSDGKGSGSASNKGSSKDTDDHPHEFDDLIDAGGGNDVVFADKGNDTVIFNFGENEHNYNFFDGGDGVDTLKLNFTSAEWAELNQGDPKVQDELIDFLQFLQEETAGGTQEAGKELFQFHSLHLSVMRFEDLQVMVDGDIIDPTNRAPVAVDDTYMVDEDATTPVILTPLDGDSDLDGDTLSIVSINGTALTPGVAQTIPVTNGVVEIDAAGEISYTPNANFNGQEQFAYVLQNGSI